jgi:hypothetical protein
MAAISSALGICPASDSLFALTSIMKRMSSSLPLVERGPVQSTTR